MRAALIVLICLLIASAACGQGYKIDWYSINSGGGAMSGGGFVLNGSAGQSTAGQASGSSILHYIGFWVPEHEGEPPPEPVVVDSPAEAKLQPNGTLISISGKIASSAAGEFDGFFYMQEEDRSSGIRVAVSLGDIPGLIRGSVVNVIGTMGTTAAGERQITGPMVVIASSTTPPDPLAMINRSIGGGDAGVPPLGQYGVSGSSGLNNIGLLVKTWGRVTYVDPAMGFFYMDDGSGLNDGFGYPGVRISIEGLATIPQVNEYLVVTGVSSMFTPGTGRHRLILPRSTYDMYRAQ